MKASSNTFRMLERNRFLTIFSLEKARSQFTWVQDKDINKRIVDRKLLNGIPKETCSLTSRNVQVMQLFSSLHTLLLYS